MLPSPLWFVIHWGRPDSPPMGPNGRAALDVWQCWQRRAASPHQPAGVVLSIVIGSQYYLLRRLHRGTTMDRRRRFGVAQASLNRNRTNMDGITRVADE